MFCSRPDVQARRLHLRPSPLPEALVFARSSSKAVCSTIISHEAQTSARPLLEILSSTEPPPNAHSSPRILPTTVLSTSVAYYGPSGLHQQTTVFLTPEGVTERCMVGKGTMLHSSGSLCRRHHHHHNLLRVTSKLILVQLPLSCKLLLALYFNQFLKHPRILTEWWLLRHSLPNSPTLLL
ncbi:hypothetical protein KFK09_029474 [Dendrobium nobile]|uniref:Uncharacterized protein n=1 Tax=Dendrobium nobile TaxID=94219 RepID=A0A8T2ZZZ4_DENNO|nr:hypothetical protein KFK09_029474 [Dendrobium nobile]